MPKVSDYWKPGFSVAASIKAGVSGNPWDATFNAVLALGQLGYAGGKYKIPGDKFGPRREGGESLKDAFGKECVILERGIQIMTALTLLHGSGTDKGQYYQMGSDKFQLAWESLKDATAESDSWTGDAAEAYNALNAAQMDWATAMSDLDLQIAAILADEADWLKNAKVTLTACRAVFTAAIPIASTLRWVSGPQASLLFQLATFAAVMPVAIFITAASMDESLQNKRKIDGISARYREVADSAVVSGSAFAPSTAAPAPRSTVSPFDEVSGDGAAPAPAPGRRHAAPSAGAAGTGETAESGGYPATGPTERAMAPAGVAPAYNMPAASRVAGGAPDAKASPRPRPAPAADADGEPAAAGENVVATDFDGAASGAAEGERAPIDKVTGTAGGPQRLSER
ncbi:hypothetical protein BN000_03875 [Mycobacterium europaeum]|uniref:ESX-1 secretion-associated protein EspA/EspE-like domain-containing protein n=1 Tax=Mycobacterium europaeum TaxID=761804 RepID=A0A0U1DJ08_9MYCO|nr:EspA/EspE family type VII secretion system effector [Mycobacterium europaeum]CQD17542.1 hypothetical protein BN000_03875 [Mycobacterium europaeum]